MTNALQPQKPHLRGKCEEEVKKLVKANPELTAVPGWYIDMCWGSQEHWWAVDQEGNIIDPTVEQFPTGHIPELREYKPYDGIYPCPGCGIEVAAPDIKQAGSTCCSACYGAMVGIYAGRCTCQPAV